MVPRLIILVLAISLSSCFPEVENDLDQGNTDLEVEVSSGPASLQLTTSNLERSDYPIAVKATITASAGAAYYLKLNNDTVASGFMPPTPILQGPASGLTDGNNLRLVYFVVAEPGNHTVTLTETLNGEVETDTAVLSNVGARCEANSDFYSNESAIGPSVFTECEQCHSEQGTATFDIDGSTYGSIASTRTLTETDYFKFAHMPANMDPTPGEGMNGGEFNHSGELRWPQDSATHFRVMELAYRVSQSFTCP